MSQPTPNDIEPQNAIVKKATKSAKQPASCSGLNYVAGPARPVSSTSHQLGVHCHFPKSRVADVTDTERAIISSFICQRQAQTNSKYRVIMVAGQYGSELN